MFRRWAFILTVLLVPLAPPAGADQTNTKLDVLFRSLQSAAGPDAAQSIEARIWQIWVHYGDPEIDRRMAIGILTMGQGDLDKSLAAFDRVVEMAPNFAEGWNKRATVHYMLGNYDASVSDIQRTLALEPRHFGALSGMGLIFDAVGNGAAAVRVWERALTIHPNMTGIRERMRELKRRLTGKPT
ncbi:MAG: tetratricopeptide repeat protein [Magnetovibrio sp.]|nr:tetratricopeptide repeat protein [Magnetovibrio sp.]